MRLPDKEGCILNLHKQTRKIALMKFNIPPQCLEMPMEIFYQKLNQIKKLDSDKFSVVPNIRQTDLWEKSDFDIYESNRIQSDTNQIIVSRGSDRTPMNSILGYKANEKVNLIACVTSILPTYTTEVPSRFLSAMKVPNPLSNTRSNSSINMINLENVGHTIKFMIWGIKKLDLAGRDRLALSKSVNVVIISHNLTSDDGDKSFTGN